MSERLIIVDQNLSKFTFDITFTDGVSPVILKFVNSGINVYEMTDLLNNIGIFSTDTPSSIKDKLAGNNVECQFIIKVGG